MSEMTVAGLNAVISAMVFDHQRELSDLRAQVSKLTAEKIGLLDEYEETVRKYRVRVYALQHKVDDAHRISDRIIDDIEQEANDEIDALMKG